MAERKWKCCSCDAISLETELLRSTNPFDKDETIEGCPICKYVCGFTEICDEPDCTRDATCGFPVANGYRRTCYQHIVRQEERGLTKRSPDAGDSAASTSFVHTSAESASEGDTAPTPRR